MSELSPIPKSNPSMPSRSIVDLNDSLFGDRLEVFVFVLQWLCVIVIHAIPSVYILKEVGLRNSSLHKLFVRFPAIIALACCFFALEILLFLIAVNLELLNILSDS